MLVGDAAVGESGRRSYEKPIWAIKMQIMPSRRSGGEWPAPPSPFSGLAPKNSPRQACPYFPGAPSSRERQRDSLPPDGRVDGQKSLVPLADEGRRHEVLLGLPHGKRPRLNSSHKF